MRAPPTLGDLADAVGLAERRLNVGFRLLFGASVLVFLFTRRGTFETIHASRPMILLGAALLVQPIAYPLVGFIIAATVLFSATSTAISTGDRLSSPTSTSVRFNAVT